MKTFLLSVLLLGFVNLNAQGGWGTNGNHQGSSTYSGGGMTASGGTYNPPPRPHAGYMVPIGMNEMQFRNLKYTIERQSFDNTKLSIAKQGIRSNSASSAQVRELMQLLTFESYKYDLAVFAYAFCVDPQQYYVVNDAFDFSSSIVNLNRELGLDRPNMGGSCGTGTGTYGNNGYQGNGYGGGGHGSGHGGGHGNGNGHVHSGGCCGTVMPVTACEFGTIRASIEKQWFDSSKLPVAKQITAAKLLTSAQVAEIMSLFSFESTKLDFAKFAYSRVFDPQNYFVVNDAFTFSSSICELQKFIR